MEYGVNYETSDSPLHPSDLTAMAVVAAILINGDPQLQAPSAASRAAEILSACRNELSRSPVSVSFVEGVRQILGRKERRPKRLEVYYRSFISTNADLLPDWIASLAREGTSTFDIKIDSGGIGKYIASKMSTGFSQEEVENQLARRRSASDPEKVLEKKKKNLTGKTARKR